MGSLVEFLLIGEEWKRPEDKTSIGSNVMCELVW
jgi:hypothetical protein